MSVHVISFRPAWWAQIKFILNPGGQMYYGSHQSVNWMTSNYHAEYMAHVTYAVKGKFEIDFGKYHNRRIGPKATAWRAIMCSKKARRQIFIVARNRLDKIAVSIGLDPTDFLEDPEDYFLTHELENNVIFQFSS